MDKLEGVIRAYPWGSRTLIPSLRGQQSPASRPEAELWYGAHPASPARLASTGEALDGVIAKDPEYQLGARVVARYGAQLPFLLKLLAAAEPLSLQAHPSKEQAVDGFARDNAAGIDLHAANRNYKDDNHKPELIVALTPFKAMAGFRPVAQTRELFAALDCPEADRYLTMLGAGGADGPDAADDAASMRALFTTWITIPHDARVTLIDAIVAAAQPRSAQADWIGGVCEVVCELNERYPGDIGVLGALLLNHVDLEPGQAVYLDAGQLHAYVRGLGVEIMANSDNVLRGGLTSKYVDIPELLRVLDFRCLDDPRVQAVDGEYPVPIDEFRLNRLEVTADGVTVDHDGPSIVMVTEGSLQAGDVQLQPGDAVWIPAGDPAVELRGKATAFWART